MEFERGDGEGPLERAPPSSPPTGGPYFTPSGGVLASLCRVSKIMTMRIRGIVHGQHVLVLVDSGEIHNFIDAQLVQRIGITIAEFEGFSVPVPRDMTM